MDREKRHILNNEKKENIIVYTLNLLSMENVAISVVYFIPT